MENNEQKENAFLRGIKAFGKYLKGVLYDFIASFRYNNMKLPAILIALPGIFLGFFLGFHGPTITKLAFTYYDVSNSSVAISLDASNNLVIDNFVFGGETYGSVTLTRGKANSKPEDAEKVANDDYDAYCYTFTYEDTTENSTAKLTHLVVSITNTKMGDRFMHSDSYDALAILNINHGTEQRASFNIVSGSPVLYELVQINIIPFDYTGMVLFVLMLAGILNIFMSLGVSGKKNLGSVIKALIPTVIVIVAGILYLYAIFACNAAVQAGKLSLTNEILDSNTIISIVSVIFSMVSATVGIVLAFIFYDRTYEKVDR